VSSESQKVIHFVEIFDLDNKVETELEIKLELDSISEESELENKLEEQYDILQNNETLLTYSEIYDYNFDDQNINILWRKSIHSYIDNFDEKFWSNCHKNHLNVFEISYNNLIIK